MEDQSRLTKELEEKRKQAEEAQLRLKQEREEAEREHERMMERVRFEQEEKDRIFQEIEQARRLAEQKALEAQQKENEARELEEQLREAKMRVSSIVSSSSHIDFINYLNLKSFASIQKSVIQNSLNPFRASFARILYAHIHISIGFSYYFTFVIASSL